MLVGAEKFAFEMFPQLNDPRFPLCRKKLTFLHAEEILDMYPDLPRKQRETAILQNYPAVFIIGIGWPLKDGYPHEMRAADYDDWVTSTERDRERHARAQWRHPGLELGHQAASRTIVDGNSRYGGDAEAATRDVEATGLHAASLSSGDSQRRIPLSVGGGIGQSRTLMLLLRKAHLGEVSVTVWPKILKRCAPGRTSSCWSRRAKTERTEGRQTELKKKG